MINHYLPQLISQIDERVLELQQFMSIGNVSDFAEYKRMCGEVKGLFSARSLISDLHERLNKDDDDE